MVGWLLAQYLSIMKHEICQQKKEGRKGNERGLDTFFADLIYIVSEDGSLVVMVVLDKDYSKQHRDIGGLKSGHI